MNLSVVILAKNEQEMIGACIESILPLEPLEILVIDDDSSDETASIAQFKGAKVLKHAKKNFAEARNFGLNKSKGEWILYIDADERISADLVHEIKQELVINSAYNAYKIRRVNYYLGKVWPHQEMLERLFKKSTLLSWSGKVHESARVQGDIGQLKNHLIHYTHRNLFEMVQNTIVWSEIEAKLRFDAGHPPVSWWRIPRVMAPVFFDYYVQQGGYRVGTVGLIESMYQSFSIFITYARLWEMQQKNT